MCGKLNIKGRVYVPGTRLPYTSYNGDMWGVWGIGNAYNARVENASTTWKRLIDNRGIILVEGFYEKDKYIHRRPLALGLLYNEQDNFVILTRDSQPSIARIHPRMPLIIENDKIEDWILHGLTYPDKIFHLNIM
jgi:putative SOS response-associated peptidase YedK